MPPKAAPARKVAGIRRPTRGGRGGNRGGAVGGGGPAHVAQPTGPAAPTAPAITPGRPTSVAARRGAIAILRQRLQPHVADARTIERYLNLNQWDRDAAYNQYASDRAWIVANPLPPPTTAPVLPGPAFTTPDFPMPVIPPAPGVTPAAVQPPAPAIPSRSSTFTNTSAATVKGASILHQANSGSESEDPEDEEGKQERLDNLRALMALWNDSIEQERRDAVLALRQQIHEATGDLLSRTEAVLLMQLADWDIGVAYTDFKSLKDALCRLHAYFDETRSKLPQVVVKEKGDVQYQQDRRLALFVTITGRNDWWSCYVFLKERHYDLPTAILDWYISGIPPVAHANDNVGYGRRVGSDLKPLPMPSIASTQPPPNQDLDWAAEPHVYAEDGDCPGYAREELAKIDRKRVQASVINERHRPVKVGEEDPSLFLFEYIKKQVYQHNRFFRGFFLWPELAWASQANSPNDPSASPTSSMDSPPPKSQKTKDGRRKKMSKPRKDGLSHANPVPFEFFKQSHVNCLNEFRRQNTSRASGEMLRDHAQHWSESELGMLWWMHLEDLCRRRAQYPDKTDEELLGMKLGRGVLQDWTDRMNQKYVGTKQKVRKGQKAQKGSDEPRVARNPNGVNTQRSRTPRIFRRFNVKPAEGKGDDMDKGTKRQRDQKEKEKETEGTQEQDQERGQEQGQEQEQEQKPGEEGDQTVDEAKEQEPAEEGKDSGEKSPGQERGDTM